MRNLTFIVLAATALCALLSSPPAAAQFSAAITPPRFELELEPGKTLRNVLEITHGGAQPGVYRVYTADWDMAADGSIRFDSNAPLAQSCRPWVALERREVRIAPSAKMRFRFEVAAPADTPAQECRFALMIESAEQTIGTGAVQIPMSGRIGVIVYARVGGVKAELRVVEVKSVSSEGQLVPALAVRNVGTATGRFTGFASATLPDGSVVDLAPNSIPILPGMERTVELLPLPPADRPNQPAATLKWPLRVKGKLDSGQRDTPQIVIDSLLQKP